MALCLLCIGCGVMLLTGGRQNSIQLVALDPVCCKEQKSVAVVSPCLDLLSALIHVTGCGQSPAFRVMLEWWWPVCAQILDHLQQRKVPGQAQITVFALGHLGMELVLWFYVLWSVIIPEVWETFAHKISPRLGEPPGIRRKKKQPTTIHLSAKKKQLVTNVLKWIIMHLKPYRCSCKSCIYACCFHFHPGSVLSSVNLNNIELLPSFTWTMEF